MRRLLSWSLSMVSRPGEAAPLYQGEGAVSAGLEIRVGAASVL